MHSISITDAFSSERLEIVEDFFNVLQTRDVQKILQMWSHHSVVLKGSRGIFAVDGAPYERPDLPGNRDFGSRGFLRCWMSSNRLLLIQNREGSSDYRYNAWINCDTNFVSFCKAFQAGRDLGALSDSFREAVTFLLPRAQMTNPIPYMLENASNPNMHKVHDTLRAFAAFQLTNACSFERSAHFDVAGSGLDPNKVAAGWIKEMGSSEFKTLAAWAKKHFLWCRVVLIKAALLVFQGPSKVEDRLYAMLKFLHEKFARIRDFEMFVAYRYFALSSSESFFKSVQQNAGDLDRTLHSMAWDLTNWRCFFEMLTQFSSEANRVPFPIPHFVSFDHPFIKLSEAFSLDGVIYAADGSRFEPFFPAEVVLSIYELRERSCQEFSSAASKRDRQHRARKGDALYEQLVEAEAVLVQELKEIMR